jgi:Ca-activated chloride channel family protein
VNLVFLLDVSGSMDSPNKLPLLKKSMKLLLEKLDERDRIGIVVYAGESGVALPSTRCSQRTRIAQAIDKLGAGGSTNGAAGIEEAYEMAGRHFIQGGVNRVILATDGDFNVGTSNRSDLADLIKEKAKSGVYLSVLGYGMGNYNDAMLEELSGKGNGNYAYIDTINEARKTLVEQLDGALITIAKDVKLQVEFNPAEVQAYRLIGYENRRLADRDFNDDKKDAGEIGAGHRVTALYEVVPVGVKFAGPDIDPLKYQKTGSEPEPNAAANSGELMTVKLRYKSPTGGASQLLSHTVANFDRDFAAASGEFKFATSVAGFGMLLRESEDMGKVTKSKVLAWANAGRGTDKHGYRDEFVRLVKKSNT